MSEIVGKYKMTSSEGFDDFMKALGVGMIMRKLGSTAKPVVEINHDEDSDTWSIKTSTTFKTTEIKFKLGEEFEETRMDGSLVKTTITREDNKLVQRQVGDKDVEIIREVNGNELKVLCKVDDILSTRIYQRCE